MDIKKAKIVNFLELSDEWQVEARSNLDEYASESLYLEPEEGHNPNDNWLADLNERMPNKGEYEGFKFNATIGISNNTAMLLKLSDDMEEAEWIIV